MSTPIQEAGMWDTVVETTSHLSHEMPCPWCRHASHSFLPCSDRCRCTGSRVLREAEPVAALTADGNRAHVAGVPSAC